MSDQKKCPQCGATLPPETPEGLCPACLLRRGFETQTAGGTAAANVTPPTPEALASRFPQLEIVELLGRGGMGVVYKARHRGLDRWVALKILPAAAERDPAFAERFSREARALAKLDHPNIVAVHDSGEADGLFYFFMEYVDGANLRQVLAAGEMKPEQALAIVPQICEALQYAHDQGIVHRDIKPENILMDKSGRVKIADFGLAKIVGMEARDFTLTGAGEMMGTPAYMAPEQVEHPSQVDHRADIYSLGVVFYQMLTGELPLGRFAPPSRKVRIDVRLDEVVLRTLEKEPGLRYQQAGEVKTEVETIAGSPSAKNTAETSGPTTTEPNPWQPVLGMIAVVINPILFMAAFLLPFPANVIIFIGSSFSFAVALLKVAGFWPWRSPLFPQSNWTGRNLQPGGGSPMTRSSMPGTMWFAVIALAAITVFQLLVAATYWNNKQFWENNQISAGWLVGGTVISAILIAGYVTRNKWAFALSLLFCAFGPIANARANESLQAGLIPLLIDALVFIPLLLSIRWFFPSEYPIQKRRYWLWAVAVATMFAAVVGVLNPFANHLSNKKSAPVPQNGAAARPWIMADNIINDIQPDGTIRIKSTLEKVNLTGKTVTRDRVVSSRLFGNPPRVLDAQGRPMAVEVKPLKDYYEWWVTLNEPVRPGEIISWVFPEATVTGEIKKVSDFGLYEYSMKHWPAVSGFTRYEALYRLPAGAEVVEKHPAELTQETKDGRTELKLDEMIPAGGFVEIRFRYHLPTQPPAASQSKRQRFEPKAGMEDKANWSVEDKPSIFNPIGWASMMRLTLGGKASVRMPGDTEDTCRIKLIDGDDDKIRLNIEDVKKKNVLTLTLNRNQDAEILVNGQGYRVRYLATDVANDQPDTSPFANVLLVRVEPKIFGSMMERVIEPANPAHRALNLVTGKFATPSAGHPLDFRISGTTSLREAGTDLFLQEGTSSLGNLTTLDMQLCIRFQPPSGDAVNLETFTADELQALLGGSEGFQGWHAQSAVNIPASDLNSALSIISGTDLYLFVTRDHVSGVLQIVGSSENLQGVKIRYKLVQNAAMPTPSGTTTSAQPASSPSAAESLDDSMKRAKAFVDLLAKGDFAKAHSEFDATMSAAMSEQMLATVWAQLETTGGKYQGHDAPRLEVFRGFTIVYVPCQWERARLDLKVVYDKAGKVTGLWVVPPGSSMSGISAATK
ncbi:MAG: protein kinase [Chthoniobacteraceae bacterium]|nr:protein kinase [Chthoniobacteraceae bacterium]